MEQEYTNRALGTGGIRHSLADFHASVGGVAGPPFALSFGHLCPNFGRNYATQLPLTHVFSNLPRVNSFVKCHRNLPTLLFRPIISSMTRGTHLQKVFNSFRVHTTFFQRPLIPLWVNKTALRIFAFTSPTIGTDNPVMDGVVLASLL